MTNKSRRIKKEVKTLLSLIRDKNKEGKRTEIIRRQLNKEKAGFRYEGRKNNKVRTRKRIEE